MFQSVALAGHTTSQEPLHQVIVTTVALLFGSSVTVAQMKFILLLCANTTPLVCITCPHQPAQRDLCIDTILSCSTVAY